MIKGMSTIKYENITWYAENTWFCVKILKFRKKTPFHQKWSFHQTVWADKVFIIMTWSFCQMEFDYFWSKNNVFFLRMLNFHNHNLEICF